MSRDAGTPEPLEVTVTGTADVTYLLTPHTGDGYFDGIPLGELLVLRSRIEHVEGLLNRAIVRAVSDAS